MNDVERFWLKVDKDGSVPQHIPDIGKCWVWTASKSADGYGFFWGGNKVRRAHRVAWEMAHGDIPAGNEVCHRCDTPSCVRDDHLFLGTHKDNVHDMAAKGRIKNGNVVKDSCKNGHLLLGENLYFSKDGYRHCRECNRVWQRARYHRSCLSKVGTA